MCHMSDVKFGLSGGTLYAEQIDTCSAVILDESLMKILIFHLDSNQLAE